MAIHSIEPVDVSQWKSPLRILVRSFQRSRDNWKQTYMALKADLKRYKNRAADARRSRERWKAKAQTLETEKRRLEAELAEWRASQEKQTNPQTRPR